MPLLTEILLLAVAGFGVGGVLGYLVELRRRANASWRW